MSDKVHDLLIEVERNVQCFQKKINKLKLFVLNYQKKPLAIDSDEILSKVL